MFHSLRSGLNLAFNQLWWYRESTSCVTFFPLPLLPYRCDICWTCRVFTGVTTGVVTPAAALRLHSDAPARAPIQWIHLHPDCRSNCHAERKANQILWQELGEEIAFPLSRREASPSLPLVLMEGKKRRLKSGKLLGYADAPVGQVGPIRPPPLQSLSTSSFHSPWHYPSVTGWHRGLHPCLQSFGWNGTIIRGIEWLWPLNWGRSDHNNTLSNLIKRPFVASAL